MMFISKHGRRPQNPPKVIILDPQRHAKLLAATQSETTIDEPFQGEGHKETVMASRARQDG